MTGPLNLLPDLSEHRKPLFPPISTAFRAVDPESADLLDPQRLCHIHSQNQEDSFMKRCIVSAPCKAR